MHIAIGCDHRGLELKQFIMKLIAGAGHTCEDYGCYTVDSVDYPDIVEKVAGAVVDGSCERGILICFSGIGMSIAANKVRGIRAALCCDASDASLARRHNDANILCLGARKGERAVPEILEAFLTGEFEGGRHALRLEKVKAMEA